MRRATGLVLGLIAFACGPSLTAVHEGSVRFEHCYRLDLDSEVVSTHRQACWKGWLTSFTYGQPRDRIDYARKRLSELQNGDPSPPALRTGSEHRPEQRQFYLVVPAPTSVHAPPPPVATVWRDEDAGTTENTSDAGSAETAAPPAEICAERCRSDWDTCTTGCTGDAGAPDASTPDAGSAECDACRKQYSGCMRKCFK